MRSVKLEMTGCKGEKELDGFDRETYQQHRDKGKNDPNLGKEQPSTLPASFDKGTQ